MGVGLGWIESRSSRLGIVPAIDEPAIQIQTEAHVAARPGLA